MSSELQQMTEMATPFVRKRLMSHTIGRHNLEGVNDPLETRSEIDGFVSEVNGGLTILNNFMMDPLIEAGLINIQGVKNAFIGEKKQPIIPTLSVATNKQARAFVRSVHDLHQYMTNSERAEREIKDHGQIQTEELRVEIVEKGNWSELHMNALDIEHFVGTLVLDLIPMVITRTEGYRFLDADQLVRSLCEVLVLTNSRSRLLRVVYDQGWITTDQNQFSSEFVSRVNELFKQK